MFDNIFGIHESALLLHAQRLSVLAANLANADTPGYKARDIDFTEVLAGAYSETGLAVSVTDPYQASLDGNTVEMPVEQAAFAEDNVRYQASLTFINNQISDLQYVISGQ